MTSAISGYFLGRTLGEHQIQLYGEHFSDAEHRVKILPPEAFLNGYETYDLIINADSLTEMDPAVARAYFDKIEKSTKIFLSINHEVNPFTVKDLIDQSTCIAEVYRAPYWMRNGYVEELVRFK